MPCELERFALDATTPIIFGNNGRWEVLQAIVGSRAVVSEEIYSECRSVRTQLDVAIDGGAIDRLSVQGERGLALFAEARGVMDAGEASTVALAAELGAIVVSDDLKAIERTGSLAGLRVIGVYDILCYAVSHEVLSPAQARAAYDMFVSGGARLPGLTQDAFSSCDGSD